MNWRNVPRLLPWLALALIAFATLASPGMRPRIEGIVQFERFAAFFVLGLLFAAFYPRRIRTVLAIVILIAIGLELLQLLMPSRHARLSDLLVKIVGGASGVAVRYLAKLIGSR